MPDDKTQKQTLKELEQLRAEVNLLRVEVLQLRRLVEEDYSDVPD